MPDVSLAEWRDWREVSVDTPRGRYTRDGPDVILVDLDGRRQVAYSTAYLQEDGNTWIQQMATKRLISRRALADEPSDLLFDETSGNLVLAMEIQGVVVGTPGGEWAEVAVGRFQPADFTFMTKTLMLLTHAGFWITALTLAFSMTAAGLFLSQYRVIRLLLLTLAALAVCVAMVISIIALVASVASFNSSLALLIGLLSPAAIVVGALVFGLRPRLMPLRDIFLIMAAVVSLLASVALLLNVGQTSDGFPIVLSIWFVIMAWVLGLACLSPMMDELTDLRPVVWSIAGNTGLVLLPTLLWLHLGTSHGLAIPSALALCAAAAIVLAAYVRRDQSRRKARWAARARSGSE